MYYGTGALGSVTIGSNTTLTARESHYTNLTVNAGITLTIPDGSFLFVSGTLTLNGTIKVQGAAGGAGGYINPNTYAGSGGNGGAAGGSALIQAATVAGSGTINASGDNGSAGSPNTGVQQNSSSTSGVSGASGSLVVSPTFKSNGQQAVSGQYGALPTVPAAYYGIADDLISYNSVQYSVLLNDYLFSGFSRFPVLVSAGSGSGGVSGTSDNSGNGQGGAGGAGGSSFGAGGKQGRANAAAGYYYYEGCGGGGGGGAGGLIILGSENITGSISINANGGNGGAAGNRTADGNTGCPGGAGGGGGGGGVYVIANKMVSATANGGTAGTFVAGSGYGAGLALPAEDGKQGLISFVSVGLFK
ncbi:hypothetical protein [Paenibacillus sp. MMO-177]|uniref:hypothetical protein n=1 Tax=Paenibacillus sp. MMO-177 TaxID=3081289 RepID=UPI003016ABFC